MLSDILNIHHSTPSTEPGVELSRTNVISDCISLILGTKYPQAARNSFFSERKPVKSIPQHPFMCCQTVSYLLGKKFFPSTF